MLIYFALFLGILFTAIIDLIIPLTKDTRRSLFIFWFLLFFVFKAFRWDTGTDWSQYLLCFNDSDWSNIFSYNRNVVGDVIMEPGYVFLNVSIKSFLPFYTAFLFITNLFILVSYTKFYNRILPRYCLQSLTLILFVTELFPVRQTIAVAIFCFGYHQIKNKSFLKYLGVVLVCSLIHFSALMLIPFYFLLKLELRFIIYVITYLTVGVIADKLFDILGVLSQLNILPSVIQQLLIVYGDQDMRVSQLGDDAGSFFPSYIFHFSLFLIIYYCYLKQPQNVNNKYKEWKTIGLNSYFITICFFGFHSIPGAADILRAQSFFWIGYILMTVYSIDILLKYKKQLIAVALLFVVCSWKMINMAAFKPNSMYHELFVPYKSILDINEKQRSEDFYH